MEQFIFDEINNIKTLIMPGKKQIDRHCVDLEYVVFANASIVSCYFACAAMLLAKGIDSMYTKIIIADDRAKPFISSFLDELDVGENGDSSKQEAFYKRITITDGIHNYLNASPNYKYNKVRFCTFLNAADAEMKQSEIQECYYEELTAVLSHIQSCPNGRLVHTETLPELLPLPDTMTSISEREYEIYCSQFTADSTEQFVLRCEEAIRFYTKQGVKASISRMQNVFGPGVSNPLVDRLCHEMEVSNSITIDPNSHNKFIDMNYITFAASQVQGMFVQGRIGHIYNLSQFVTTPFQLVADVYGFLADHGATLSTAVTTHAGNEYRLLCRKKAQPILVSKYAQGDLATCVYKSIVSTTGLPYQNRNDRYIYDGKLDQIKKIEIEMMLEIKRICEKHNIKYFLVGGSMLGAVRHKGFIPWDDDLDIGMLREDYEKFAAVAPGELDHKYYYQSCTSDDNSHYIFDKIRLKDTFFSTAFSDRFPMENGLFIDILVYDKTAKELSAQQRHIRQLCIWSRAINVRWVNIARKGVAYRLSKLLLPIMRLFPMRMYHDIFNTILTRYNHTDSQWLIDGVGQNIRKGAFPAEWFDEVIEVPFENITLPIPVKYDAYLRHWYGDKYMELLPVSQRNSGHMMKRIDLGSYITNLGFACGNYHHASRNGELFDEYTTEED